MVGQLLIVCPKTGKEIQTGIVVEEAAFLSELPMQSSTKCPACRGMHTWTKKDARFQP